MVGLYGPGQALIALGITLPAALVLLAGAVFVAVRGGLRIRALYGVSAGLVLWSIGVLVGPLGQLADSLLGYAYYGVASMAAGALSVAAFALGAGAVLVGVAMAIVAVAPVEAEP